jgi:hypothetical protein
MKKQIRRGVFETNSSSVHTLTMCSGEEYKKWENGEVLFWRDADTFSTREEIIEELKVKKTWSGELYYPDTNWNDEDEVNDVFEEEGIQTCDEFFDDEYYETFYDDYTTPNGDKVVVFGYYGYN